MKYDLDEATAAVESQSFSVSELYAEINALHSSTEELISSYKNSTAEIDENHERASILIAKLKQLGDSSEKTAEAQVQMKAIAAELNQLYPNLGISAENVAVNIDKITEASDRAWAAQSRQIKHEQAESQLNNLLVEETKLQQLYEQAAFTQQAAREKYLKTYGDGSNWFETTFKSDWAFINGTGKTVTQDLEKANENAAMALQDLRAVQEQIAQIKSEEAEYDAIVTGTSDDIISSYDAVSLAIGNTTEETEALLQAYNDAYQAAYDSVSGQYNLWTEAEKSIPTSIDSINSSLSSQQDYWDSYSADLEKLLGKTGEIDGLRDVLASFADGSADSVNAIAGMADASDEQLKKMVENYQKVQEEEEKVASMLAEVKVDFKSELDEITDTMQEAVETMNMDDEARQAANDTISAYIAALKSGAGSAYAAADLVKQSTAAALEGLSMPTSNQIVGPRLPNIENAYASGTQSAVPGWAIVGEEGPEAVFMRGGETVYNARETRDMLGGTQITIAPSFVVNGGNIAEEQLMEFSEQLVEMVKDALNEAGIDRQRSVYS